jgi:anthranilate phosphoribosyltransferase
MVKEALAKLLARTDLTEEEARSCMLQIMEGEVSQPQMAAFLIALRMKGEKPEEIAGMAAAMRDKAVAVKVKRRPLLDTCGTGGDGSRTFNISTAVALVASGAGAAVAKHGNRSVSSRCGSADVLEALGIRLEMPPEVVAQSIEEGGIGFLFAPAFHPAMKHAAPVRRELGVRTVFNLLGPLTNPARATRHLLGVPSPEWTEPIALVLARMGAERAFVVHGLDGMDEISTGAETQVSEVTGGEVRTYKVRPQDFGIEEGRLDRLAGGDAQQNAALLLEILQGKTGPGRDIVLINSAAALVAAGLALSWHEGMQRAAESIASGSAIAKLEALRRFSQAAA